MLSFSWATLRVIWGLAKFSAVSRATAPSVLFFSRATLWVIWAWLLYPPGYLGWALSAGPPSGLFGPGYCTVPSGLFGLGTLWVVFQPSHPPGPLRVIWAWLLYLPGYLGWAPCLRVIWGLAKFSAVSRALGRATAPSGLFYSRALRVIWAGHPPGY